MFPFDTVESRTKIRTKTSAISTFKEQTYLDSGVSEEIIYDEIPPVFFGNRAGWN